MTPWTTRPKTPPRPLDTARETRLKPKKSPRLGTVPAVLRTATVTALPSLKKKNRYHRSTTSPSIRLHARDTSL